ncbi:hypothetical protein U1Q18_027653, partial [Sarracenia purpurea var. burkii]
MGEPKMRRGKDHDKVGELDIFARSSTHQVMDFLERRPSGNHINYVPPNLNDKLLGHNN